GRDPCGELADLHHTRFRILSRLGDVAAMAEITAELLSVAERLALPRATAEANLADSICCLWRDDIAGARERALFALQGAGSFSEGRELAIRCLAHNELAAIGMYGGDHRFMRYYAERGLDLAKRLGMPFVEVILRLRLANANFMSGAWEESLQDSIDAIGLARRIGQPRDLACALAERALILAMRGDLALAEGCISEIRQVFGRGTSADRGVFGVVEIAEATLALERGQGERALAIARRFLRPSASAATSVGLTAAKRPTGFALLAEAQVAAGDGVGALETARRIIGLGPAGTPYLAALASRAEGLARQALREKQPAMECLRQAHEEFTALEMPFEAARSLLELAEVGGQETGARDQTPSPRSLSPERAAQQSLATFERLGARRYAERARRLLRGFGFSPPVTLLPRLGGVSVSERELEVARLVAEGLTATEIARRLTISPRTVTTHLEHIYARLHISSRAALVRQVMEAGLLNPQDHNTKSIRCFPDVHGR
ncbi:MAG: helix-turn-helix transcriptional regulator, partial [Dehalococcoidia bacterium]|nr:helix-turn-helix transcriptional regulator [Dehalococcoidia bacterium]